MYCNYISRSLKDVFSSLWFVQTIGKLVDSSGTIVYRNNVVQSGNKIGNKSLDLQADERFI